MRLGSHLVVLLLAQSATADLRIGSGAPNGWPKTGFGYQVANVPPDTSLPRAVSAYRRLGPMKRTNSKTTRGPWAKLQLGYMEPSTFGYRGLGSFAQTGNPGPPGRKENLRREQDGAPNGGQRSANYDQFLRSNIDNEQDRRDFENDAGQDHLPFRTWMAQTYPSYHWSETPTTSRRRRIKYAGKPEVFKPGEGEVKGATVDLVAEVKPGESKLVPLIWNNPHASELEVNIWIFEHSAGKQPIVVPIRLPTCSGEGYGRNIIKFTVPSDFGDLGAKIPGFKGCNADTKPLCTVQIYAHSVESRTYSLGFPIVVGGHKSALRTSSRDSIRAASKDPWLDLTALRDLCLPSNDKQAAIPNAVPRWARLVSDVYNHAYQNSDFSPYSGQQHESISQNLQAAAINKMVTGNRGELGRSILPEDTYKRIKQLQVLENRIFTNYEALANKIIGDDTSIKRLCPHPMPKYSCGLEFPNAINQRMKTTAIIGTKTRKGGPIMEGDMMAVLDECFRCAEVGSMSKRREHQSTYIPSFQLPRSLIAEARRLVPAKYSDLITESGQVRIYVQTLVDLLPFFYVSQHYGIIYQEAMLKTTLGTKPDATKFKKRDAKGNFDEGVFAATLAKVEFASSLGCRQSCFKGGKATCITKEKTLIKGGKPTCATGECEKCSLLFSNWPQKMQTVPVLTPVASTIIASGLPSSMPGALKDGDPDGSPRIGRPIATGEAEVPTPDQPQWKFATPAPTPTMSPSPPSTQSPSAGSARRRRRRRRRSSRRSRRRRRVGRRRRQRKSHSQRRGRAELDLQQLLEEVGTQLQQ